MLENMYELIEEGALGKYAWLLRSGTADGSVGLKDLMLLIVRLITSAAAFAEDDLWLDSTRYMTQGETNWSCAGFAFALLKKGLLDGRWRCEGGALTDGAETFPLGRIIDPEPEAEWQKKDFIHLYSRLFRELLHFEPEQQAFLLAPLDHCTAENAVAVMAVVEEMRRSEIRSAEQLRRKQKIRPEGLTPGELRNAVREEIWFFHFPEIASKEELERANDADLRFLTAKTAAEAVLAETEWEFWTMHPLLFPETAYQIVTGQLTELPFASGTGGEDSPDEPLPQPGVWRLASEDCEEADRVEQLWDKAESRQIREFAGSLLTDFTAGSIGLKELMDLIDQLTHLQAALDGKGSYSYIPTGDMVGFCAEFAFALLKKGLLEGRWRRESGALTDGTDTLPLREVVIPDRDLEWRHWVRSLCHRHFPDEVAEPDPIPVYDGFTLAWSALFRDLLDFDPEKEAFQLAPLDHCTEENVLAVLTLVSWMRSRNISSRKDLRQHEPTRPKRCTKAELTEAIARLNFSTFCYFFLENADSDESEQERALYSRVQDAQTAAEAVIAQTERDFWVCGGNSVTFPYTAWLLLTGQLTELPFRTDEQSGQE